MLVEAEVDRWERCVRCDQCQFGITSVENEGNVGLACKATGFMTNDEYIAEAVDTLFWWTRPHPVVAWQSEILWKVSPTVGGSDTACFATEHASRERGEAQRMMGRDRQLTIAAVEVGPTLEEPEFRDRSTGLPLNSEMVKKARGLEMQHMEDLKVLEDSDRDACITETGRQPIPGRHQQGRFAQTQLQKQAGLSRHTLTVNN